MSETGTTSSSTGSAVRDDTSVSPSKKPNDNILIKTFGPLLETLNILKKVFGQVGDEVGMYDLKVRSDEEVEEALAHRSLYDHSGGLDAPPALAAH